MNTTHTTEKPQLRAPDVWPTFQAHDAPALIDFLVDTVGFQRTAVYRDGDRVAHAQLDWPEGGGIMLGSYDPSGEKGCLQPGTSGAYIVTAHVDALHARLTAAGVTLVREIEDQPYGSREFAIADPEGNTWSFGTYPGEPRGQD
ncbi:VOC family protein [Streptomyces sp. NA02950]|uniref:VOC family protein n=1 Tax=Streptomyces sp. NA02950 TaxID=2742137 RepID=UPI00158FEC17|nr:VOC family protein [Streptomyces sp. NA02950]QKV91244.1 VOC family protein [Streptomyces sp. NA02950]